MAILKGPVKVDLIFDKPHQHEPPWVVSKDTLNEINSHFWDWILWIGSKHVRGLEILVREELEKMNSFLLSPLGAAGKPVSVEEEVNSFHSAFHKQKDLLQGQVDPALEREVLGGLRSMGFRV
jgi:hypothetical protein